MSLVLSSKGDSYYRVTPDSCTCKGWHYSQQRYGVGKCRHHTLAFPVEAKQNAETLKMVEGPRRLARPPEESDSIRPKLPAFKPFDLLPSEQKAKEVA